LLSQFDHSSIIGRPVLYFIIDAFSRMVVGIGVGLEGPSWAALQTVRSKLNDSIGRGNKTNSRSTGELAAALGVSPARIDRNGNANVKIGFKEPRSGGKSNAMIANVLEYGKHGQPPRPFLKPAKAASRASVITAMEQKLDEELSNL